MTDRLPGAPDGAAPDDAALLADLARVLEAADPPPPGLAERALFALSLARLEAELAEIQHLVPAGIRSEEVVRTVTFTASHVTVMITVTPTEPGLVRVDGWVAPGARYRIEVHRPGSVTEVDTDDDGAFVLEVPAGAAGLVLHRADGTGPTVSTPVVEW